jgi:HSP20 family protein
MLPAIRNNGALVPSVAPVNRLGTLFDRFFNDDWFPPLAAPAWKAMPLSLWEDEHNVSVEIDASGLTEKDVELSVHDGELIVRGERKCERKEGGYDTRCYGRFEQRVSLPTPVDTDKVEARLANGVLSVTFPKSEQAKPRKIALESQ